MTGQRRHQVKLFRAYAWIDALLPNEAFLAPVVVIFYLEYVKTDFNTYSSLIAALLILNVATEVPLGWVADRIGHRVSLVLGDAIYLLGFVLLLTYPSPVTLIPFAFLLSIGQSLASGNFEVVGYGTYSRHGLDSEFGKFLSKLGAFAVTSSALAALIGGMLADRAIWLPMLLDTIVLAVKLMSSFLLLIALWPHEDSMEKARVDLGPKVAQFLESARLFLTPSLLLPAALGAISFATLRSSLNFYQPVLETLGWTGTHLGYLFCGSIILSSVFSLLISRFLNKDMTTVTISNFLGVGLLISGVSFLLTLSSQLFFIFGFISHQLIRIVVPAQVAAQIQRAIPTEFPHRTTVTSIGFAFGACFTALVSGIAGFITETYLSYIHTLGAISLISACLAFVVLLIRRRTASSKT